jgi:ATP-dependent DNA ligase
MPAKTAPVFVVNPQLCKTLNEDKFVIGAPGYWILEPKFDGLRCIIARAGQGQEVRAYSRNGKPLWNIDHILEELRRINTPTSFVLDGELYTQDWNLSMGIVKSSKTIHPRAKEVKFHVWDFIHYDSWTNGKTEDNWSLRQQYLSEVFGQPFEHIHRVAGKQVHNLEEARVAYMEFLEQGYEGGILKDPYGIYQLGKRAPWWLKWKPWTDADLTIIDAFIGKGKHEGRLGGLLLQGKTEWRDKEYEITTEVGTGFNDQERTEYWDRYIAGGLVGLTAEIKYQDITVDGRCRFPVFHRLREDK